jgi:hypothetical protein
MKMRRFTQIPGMAFAVLLALLVGSVGANDSKLEGTWDVILRFPEETCNRAECNCIPPDIPVQTVNTFLKHGGMLWTTSNLRVGPGQGRWERLEHNRFEAHFKFTIFALDTGFSTGSEDVTQTIHLTGRDAYEGTMIYDLFDAQGNIVAEGCSVNIESATRIE